MRRPLLAGVLAALIALAALVPVAPAQARQPVPFTNGTLPANRCGFPTFIAAVTNNEYQNVTTLADGTTIQKVTGNLVVSFTNEVTGKTIVRNVSGPYTQTTRPDGTGTQVAEGPNFWTFGPIIQGNTGEPGLVFTTGRAVLQFADGAGTSFSVSGTQVDGCALLT